MYEPILAADLRVCLQWLCLQRSCQSSNIHSLILHTLRRPALYPSLLPTIRDNLPCVPTSHPPLTLPTHRRGHQLAVAGEGQRLGGGLGRRLGELHIDGGRRERPCVDWCGCAVLKLELGPEGGVGAGGAAALEGDLRAEDSGTGEWLEKGAHVKPTLSQRVCPQ